MAAVFEPERAAAVARELTKAHESVYRGSLARLLQIAGEDANLARGEITVVLAGKAEAAPDDAFVRRALDLLSAEFPPSRAAAVVAQLTGRRKAEIYALVHRTEAETP